ncbi:hypothetical protein PC123_g28436, partial [Phytophthora cactorum]
MAASETTPLRLRSTSLQYNLRIWRREEARKRDLKRGGVFILALCAISLMVMYVAEPLVDNGESDDAEPLVQTHAATQGVPANMTTADNEV